MKFYFTQFSNGEEIILVVHDGECCIIKDGCCTYQYASDNFAPENTEGLQELNLLEFLLRYPNIDKQIKKWDTCSTKHEWCGAIADCSYKNHIVVLLFIKIREYYSASGDDCDV
jgi:hypothetical protein